VSDRSADGGQPGWGPPPQQWGPPAPVWGPPPWGPPPSGPGGLSGLAWTGIGLGIAAAVAVAVLFAVAVVRALPSAPAVSASSCQEAVPAGASPAAATYLQALNTGYIGWTQVSRSLVSEHHIVHLDDLENEDATDRAFLDTVEQITFTGPAAATAQQYTQVVSAYVHALDTAISQYGYYANDHQVFDQLDNGRDVLAHEMRADLDLPAARCSVLRP
jgi:hypothetical protein